VPFIIPDECELGYTVWRNPNDPTRSGMREIEDRVAKVAATDRWLAAADNAGRDGGIDSRTPAHVWPAKNGNGSGEAPVSFHD